MKTGGASRIAISDRFRVEDLNMPSSRDARCFPIAVAFPPIKLAWQAKRKREFGESPKLNPQL